MKVTLVAWARPNFMKIAPIIHEIKRVQKLGKDITFRLVHTGQHYDEKLSHSFFKQLNIPEPDINLGVGSGSHAEQTANIMVKFEKLNPNLSSPVSIPVYREFLSARWGYEALAVKQFKDNRYEQQF